MFNKPFTIEIHENSVIVNGIKYIREKLPENKVSIYLMRDNHSTIRIYNTTITGVVNKIKRTVRAIKDADTGTAFLLDANDKEIKRQNFKVSNLDDLTRFLNSSEVKPFLHTNTEKKNIKRG